MNNENDHDITVLSQLSPESFAGLQERMAESEALRRQRRRQEEHVRRQQTQQALERLLCIDLGNLSEAASQQLETAVSEAITNLTVTLTGSGFNLAEVHRIRDIILMNGTLPEGVPVYMMDWIKEQLVAYIDAEVVTKQRQMKRRYRPVGLNHAGWVTGPYTHAEDAGPLTYGRPFPPVNIFDFEGVVFGRWVSGAESDEAVRATFNDSACWGHTNANGILYSKRKASGSRTLTRAERLSHLGLKDHADFIMGYVVVALMNGKTVKQAQTYDTEDVLRATTQHFSALVEEGDHFVIAKRVYGRRSDAVAAADAIQSRGKLTARDVAKGVGAFLGGRG